MKIIKTNNMIRLHLNLSFTLALVLGSIAAILGAHAVTIKKAAPSGINAQHSSFLSVVEQDAQAAAAAEGAFLYDYGSTL